ncbi:MAG: hypothetical protein M0T69_12355 [Deltaproteobacteria bacterium]|nr:hypothetical protein [Deltaproteobacteria bacterium]
MNGNTDRTGLLLLLIILFACPELAAAEWDESIRVCFDATDAEFVKLPDGFPDSELDVLDDTGGRYKAVVIDIDDDGSPELFFPCACGNGGCDYPIYSDRQQAVIGRVFGSPICVLRKTENRRPLLQAYSRSGAGTGTIVRHAFDGKRFKEIYTAATEGKEDESVVRAIAKAPFKKSGSR